MAKGIIRVYKIYMSSMTANYQKKSIIFSVSLKRFHFSVLMVRLLTLRCQKTSERLNHSWKASLAVKKTSKFLLMFIKFTLCVFGEKSFALNKLSSCILVKLVNTKNWEIDSFCSNRAEDSLVSAKCWSNVLSNSFNWLGLSYPQERIWKFVIYKFEMTLKLTMREYFQNWNV